MGSHPSTDCKERKLEHCKDCHIYIRHFSDHTTVCANKNWIYDVYDNLYVAMPLQRCNIGFDCDVRFYMNENWRKASEGVDAYSTSNGIYLRFATDKDLSLLSNSFGHARIVVVVKDNNGNLIQKLTLMTSKTKMMLAVSMNKPFDQADGKSDASLILAVSGNPRISISLFPKNGLARHHDLRFDSVTKEFHIPDELKIEAATPLSETAQPCTTVAVHGALTRSVNIAVDEQQPNDRCYECHVPVKRSEDHAKQCGAKWYVSQRQNVYVKIPAIRFVLRFAQPPRVLVNGKFVKIERDGNYFSPMSDTLFKITTTGTIELLTTGFTRVRIPILVEEVNGSTKMFKEKMVLMTSHDRTIVCAKGSRYIDPAKGLDMYKHNTPLMLCVIGNAGATVKVDVPSRGVNVDRYEIPYHIGENSFQIPRQLDVASKQFNFNMFDADLPQKKQKQQYY